MKIGYLIYNLDATNGYGRYACEVIEAAKKSGYDTVVLTEKPDAPNDHAILRRRMGLFVSVWQSIKYLKDCDIIHALDLYPYGLIAYLANIFLRKKLVITATGTYSIAPFYNPKTAHLSALACRSADAIIAISNYTAGELRKRVPQAKLHIINPGIDFSRSFQAHRESTEKYILSVGALKKRKGYHISIPAFAEAKKSVPDLRYKIVGSQRNKGYFSELKQLAIHNGVERDVDFVENVTEADLRNLYAGAKAFILTSINDGYHFEGFGLVFVEAAASGLPVIGTRGNGIEDAVLADENGRLVDQNDVHGTVKAIVNIMDDTVWGTMSGKSYEWAKKHDNIIVDAEYISLYRHICTIL